MTFTVHINDEKISVEKSFYSEFLKKIPPEQYEYNK